MRYSPPTSHIGKGLPRSVTFMGTAWTETGGAGARGHQGFGEWGIRLENRLRAGPWTAPSDLNRLLALGWAQDSSLCLHSSSLAFTFRFLYSQLKHGFLSPRQREEVSPTHHCLPQSSGTPVLGSWKPAEKSEEIYGRKQRKRVKCPQQGREG